MLRTRLVLLILTVTALLGLNALPAYAHPADEAAVFHYLWLQPKPGEVSLQHATLVGGLLTQSVWPEIDRNNDQELSIEEQEAYAQSLAAGLSLSIDGKRVPWKLQAYEFPSHTEFFGNSLAAIKLLLTAKLPPVKAAGRTIEIRDETYPHFKGAFPQPKILPTKLGAGEPEITEDGRVTRVRLTPAGAALTVPELPKLSTDTPSGYATSQPKGKPRLPGLEITPNPTANTPSTAPGELPSLDTKKLFPKPESFVVSVDRGPEGEAGKLKGLLKQPLSPGLIGFALFVALVAGMAHALSPGHGKAMVAAYLVGSRGTVGDAILLGVVVTITHTLGVYILGFLTLWLTTSFQVAQVGQWLEVISGILVLGMGFWLFQRGLLAYHGIRELPGHTHGPGGHSHGHVHAHETASHSHNHSHGHSHAPGHEHAHSSVAVPDAQRPAPNRRPPTDSPLDDSESITGASADGKPDRWGLIGLGVAGGMVPCFDALAILVAAVNLASGRPPDEKARYIAAGLGLIAAFSVGMAVVLVAIGVLMVKAKDVMSRFTGESQWVKILPAASGAILFFLGAWLTLQALVHAGVLRLG